VQFESPDAKRIIEILPGTGTEAVDGNGKRGNSNFTHREIVFKARLWVEKQGEKLSFAGKADPPYLAALAGRNDKSRCARGSE
jgi:hypothetical protein